MAEYRLPEHKYTEAEYLFQTIDMAKSDEEFDLTSPSRRTDFLADCGTDSVHDTSTYNWRVVKRRHRYHRYTVSHSSGAPPAPPSTPTSLTATATPTPSPTAASSTNSIVAATTAAAEVGERLNNLFYILDYAPKYKMKVLNKEQQRTDAELASLLNVITLSNNNSSSNSSSTGGGGGGVTTTPMEHRICATSRTIKKPAATSMKIFKIQRNPKWFFREPDNEEDSVSAPEYDSDERGTTISRYRRLSSRRKVRSALHKRRFEYFKQQERMEALMHDFGNAMTFNEV